VEVEEEEGLSFKYELNVGLRFVFVFAGVGFLLFDGGESLTREWRCIHDLSVGPGVLAKEISEGIVSLTLLLVSAWI